MNSKRVLTAVLASAVAFSIQAKADDGGDEAPPAKHHAKKHDKQEKQESSEIRDLRDQLKQQQAEIDELKQALLGRTQQAQSAQQAATDAQAQAVQAAQAAQAASAAAADASTKVDTVQTNVNDLKTSQQTLQENVVTNQAQVQQEIHEPGTIHYKGVEITPGGFLAAEGVYRQHAVNSDINTPLNSIPFPSANEGHVSELNFTSRQSRLSVLVAGDTGKFKLSGYYEMDFLGTGTSSNNNQSNSYVLRQRQIWGKVENGAGFAMTGGQMWSLVTEDRRSTDTRTEILPNTIDSQYLVGYSWERQPGFRVQQKFGTLNTGMFTVAASAEQAQITNFTASNLPSTFQFFFAGTGQNGGLYNAAAADPGNNVSGSVSGLTTYANNVAPDVVVKAAFDLPMFHMEVGGLGRFMRDYYYPVTYGGTAAAPTYTYAANETSHTAYGGGVFGSARVYVGKVSEIAVQAMAGQGVGRYGSAQLADTTLRPDETLEPIRNYHGLFSFENHITPKLDVYAYYGGEYAQRTIYALPVTGTQIGYGPYTLSDVGCYNLPGATLAGGNTGGTGGSISATGTCASPTRYIQEAMGGLTWKPINSPKYGRLQYQLTYSYIQRNLWSGINVPTTGATTTPNGPRATEPMVHVSMRYYIP